MSITREDVIRYLESLSPDEMETFLAELQSRTGIPLPADTPHPTWTMGAPLPDPHENSLCSLRLLDVGASKIEVIVALRGLNPRLGLKEAVDLVSSAPVTLLEFLDRHEAMHAQQLLTKAGARVELR